MKNWQKNLFLIWLSQFLAMGGYSMAMPFIPLFIKSRLGDFERKKSDLFKLISDLELVVPDRELYRLLNGDALFELSRVRESELNDRIYINALDLMYLWMRQPRAPQVIGKVLAAASFEERRLFSALQHRLSCEKEVTELLESGVLGGDCSRALHFYTKAWKLYLEELDHLQLEKKF